MKKDSFLSHADFIRQSDEIKRRQKRLLEVREQSKKMTSAMLERMKNEAENHYRNTENELLCKIRDQHFKELASIRKEYEQCIYNVNRKCYDEIMADKGKITIPSVKKVSELKKQPDVNKVNSPEQIQDNRVDLNLQSHASNIAGNHTYRKICPPVQVQDNRIDLNLQSHVSSTAGHHGKTCRKINKSYSNRKSIETCLLPECIVMDSDNDANEEVPRTLDLPNAECASKYRLNVMYSRLVHDRIRILEQKEKVLRRRIPSFQKGDAIIRRNKPNRYYEHLSKNRVKSVSGDRVDKAVNTDEKTEYSTSYVAPRSQSLSPSPSSSFSSTVTEKKTHYADNVIKDMKRLNIKKKLLTAELCDMKNATMTPVTAIIKNKTEELRNLCRKSKGTINDIESRHENSRKNEAVKQSISRQNNDKEVISVNNPIVGTGVRTEKMTVNNSKRVLQSSVSSNRAEDKEIECDDKSRCALNEMKIPENVDSKVCKPLRKRLQTYVHKTKDIVVTVHTGKRCNEITAVDGVQSRRLLDNHQEDAIGQNVSSSMSSFDGSVHYDPKENTENIKVTVNVLAASADDDSARKIKKKRTVNEDEKCFRVSRKEKHLMANKVSNWRTVFENSEKLTESSYFSPPPSTTLPVFPVSENDKVDFISPSNSSHNDTDATVNSSVNDIGYYVAKLLLMSPESIENLNSVSITSQSENLNENLEVDAYKNNNKHSKLSTIVYAPGRHHHHRHRHHKHYGHSPDHDFHENKVPTKKVSSRRTETESKRCQDKRTTNMHKVADHLYTEFSSSGRGNLGSDSNANDKHESEADIAGKSVNVRSLLFKYLQAAAATSTTRCRPDIMTDNELSPLQSPRQLQKNAEKRKRRERKPLFVNKKLAYYANSFEEQIDVSSSTSDISGVCVVDKPDTNFIPERHAECNTNTNTDGSSPTSGIHCSSAAVVVLKSASIDTTSVNSHAVSATTTTTKPAISAIGTVENSQKKDDGVDVSVDHACRPSLPLVGSENSNEDQEISFSSVEALLKQNMRWLSTGSDKPLTAAEVSMSANESNEVLDVEELMRGWLKINYPKNQNLDDDADATANVNIYDDICVRPDDSNSVAERNIVAKGSTNYSSQSIGTSVQVSEHATVVDENINDQFCDEASKSSNDIIRKSRLLRWMGSTMQRTLEASAVNSSSSFEEFGKAID